ncbi:hypothetical protein C2I36_15020 [Rhodobacteraceae bacterium WD3A24]|nr:hypothetical protein C2I36_15020 [Rhodobacteraceae bacterium WD3A24]
MIRLNMKGGPWWLEIGEGVRVQVRPVSTSLMMEARKDPELRALPEDADDEETGYVFARALARRAILDWEGVVDGNGKPAKVTPEATDALLENWTAFEAFQSGYLLPAMDVEKEKNASAPSPSGPTAGAKTTAKPARKSARSARKK